MESKTVIYGYLRGLLLDEIAIEDVDSSSAKIEELIANGWKIVEPLDEELLGSAPEYHSYKMAACDNGDTITHRYELVLDRGSINREIERLKVKLDGSDYKVIKCMESTLHGVELPYAKELIIKEREDVRVAIRGLEEKLINKNENEKQ